VNLRRVIGRGGNTFVPMQNDRQLRSCVNKLRRRHLKMTKIAINTCYGGFSISDKAFELLLKKKNIKFNKVKSDRDWDYKDMKGNYLSPYDFYEDRSDPDLIDVIETLKGKANDWSSNLKIIEIPDDVEWVIEEYDGNEWVSEVHRIWR
jgi:hypothetical protein